MPAVSEIKVDPLAACHEAAAWESVRPGWKQLYGDFHRQGLSIEEHDFRAGRSLDWASSFHPESVEVCLNLAGRGEVIAARQRADFTERTVGHYAMANRKLTARRNEGDRHQFITVEMSRDFVLRQVAGNEPTLRPSVRSFLEGRPNGSVSEVSALPPAYEALVAGLRNPPVTAGARLLWYQAKVLELMAQLFFASAESELFCTRQKRLARDRTEAVMILLRNHLQEPPSLEEIARQIGCSPFHLSRNFSVQTGVTIPQYLRQARMERAAELLRSGSYNVTEVAFTVGYSSLGHFSKSFCEVIGCCPSLYPHALPAVRKARTAGPE
jgi:AraC-like DNA-binding protein